MRIGILGTGQVAQVLAARLSAAGHAVTLASRDPATKGDLAYPVGPLADTVRGSDVVVNATKGDTVLELVAAIGTDPFDGKTVVDVANALTPTFALAYPNDSLGRLLQEALPGAHVVKTLNTVNLHVMADPGRLATTSVFVSGDDPVAKKETAALLADLGWAPDAVVDTGGIATARGPEHYSVLFFVLAQALGTRAMNISVQR